MFPKELGEVWMVSQKMVFDSNSVGLHTAFESSHQQERTPSIVPDTFSIHKIPARYKDKL